MELRDRFGRDMICQEGLEYWEIRTFFVRLTISVGFLFGVVFFFPSGVKTCLQDSSVAEISAVSLSPAFSGY